MTSFNNDTDKKRAKQIIQDIVDSMTRVDAEKDLQKERISMMKDLFELSPARTRSLAKIIFKQNMDEIKEAHEELETLVEQLQ